MRPSHQLGIVDVLFCARHHLKDVKEFFLPEADQLSELTCARFLVVGRLVIDLFSSDESCLLRKGLQVALVL